MQQSWRIAVVGGGIAGLAAALRLRDRAPAGTRITVYEQSDELGGKLRTEDFAGLPVERGAEAFLMRDPAGGDSAAVALARRVGLGDRLRHPAVGQAALARGGQFVALPAGTLIGVPGDLAAVARVARAEPERDADQGRPLLQPDDDVAVGELVRRRLGDEVVEQLVDPMLGGVYAGRADTLSLATTIPGLAAAARTEHTLVAAVRAALAARPPAAGAPVFATVDGGLSRLVAAVRGALSAADGAAEVRLRTSAVVRELAASSDGWRLTVGPTRGAERVDVDAVVLAVPARPAARLLAAVDAAAALRVGALEYASIALVTLAVPQPQLPEISGFLVPATERTMTKAVTLFSTKWAQLRRSDGLAVVRASVGRHGDERLLQRSDDELVDAVRTELTRLTGVRQPAAVQSHVQRWGGALPQYPPGHLSRVAAARWSLRSAGHRLALAGAAYDGIGIPVCVRSGENAADEILTNLEGVRR
ncbi:MULTISPECIES: protoporphyrinogen oxidase [unclassified Solwaraspora]|uniref:protoporphyrinogen oxidase n=1 Tax=unclassified Solwaraspora TaxID=2627926 RepID=UPI00248C093A|nr:MULTISPECIES: protoporphyrinogen oxidase [unclassified Solwaraspora]WBB98725.1 protoporphyrinogen oxidase [Solwaraspora sp. WMMA2059]WBC22722.1 protoporphyrinogen oxidase [Solwaraspora sp. WMMA2080]WJK35228.1 protoporphyrinogen oxidase [Solwaraspora sp. WMMA2065]